MECLVICIMVNWIKFGYVNSIWIKVIDFILNLLLFLLSQYFERGHGIHSEKTKEFIRSVNETLTK